MGWLRIYLENDRIVVEEEVTSIVRYFHAIDYEIDSTTVYLRCHYHEFSEQYEVLFADLQDRDGDVVVDIPAYLSGVSKTKVDATLQSSTSPLIIIKASKLLGETTLSSAVSVGDLTITVNDASSAFLGALVTIYSVASNTVTFGTVLTISGNDITIDTPVDLPYSTGDFVSFGDTNMAVDGSVTPQVFGVRNPTGQDVDFTVDFTRMLLSMTTSTEGDFSQFGNIPALTKGVVLRFKDGYYSNIFNVKSNAEFAELMYDFEFIPAKGSADAGVSGRFTFQKLGSVIRLKPFEDLEFVIQDDLSSLVKFNATVEGAGVTN
jgi:hypothetical protein